MGKIGRAHDILVLHILVRVCGDLTHLMCYQLSLYSLDLDDSGEALILDDPPAQPEKEGDDSSSSSPADNELAKPVADKPIDTGHGDEGEGRTSNCRNRHFKWILYFLLLIMLLW